MVEREAPGMLNRLDGAFLEGLAPFEARDGIDPTRIERRRDFAKASNRRRRLP
jgi:hypothetical protein